MEEEVKHIIKKLKNNVTPGIDKIENETLKELENVLAPILTELFNLILNTKEIPDQWNEVEIISLLKNGDRKQIKKTTDLSVYHPT